MGLAWHDNLMQSTMHGKIWWGNSANAPLCGTDPNKGKNFQPKTFLEKKDLTIFHNLIFERMKRFGYIDRPETIRELSKGHLLLLMLLPTAPEWHLLKLMFDRSYWLEAIRKTWQDDPVFDPYLKTRSKMRQFLRHIRVFNPLKWIYYFLMRIAYDCQFAIRGRGKREKIPALLLEYLPQ